MTSLLLVGHGRMGRLVESLAAEYGFEVAGVVTSRTPPSADWPAGWRVSEVTSSVRSYFSIFWNMRIRSG